MHSSVTRIPFTQAAYDEMVAEVAKLTPLLDEVMGRLKIAREMGDLSENGAYRYAKFELGNIRRRLKQLNYLIERAEIIVNQDTGKAEFGNTITLKNKDKILTFQLVSEHESNPAQGKLSTKSPIGHATYHRRVGDTFSVITPQGKIEYILEKIA